MHPGKNDSIPESKDVILYIAIPHNTKFIVKQKLLSV